MLFYSTLLTCLLLFLGSPGIFSVPQLMWIALVPFFLVIPTCPPKQAFKIGLGCGVIYYVSILYWIIIVLGKYGNLPLWISIPALLLLSLYMSLYLGFFGAVITWSKKVPLLWIAPPLWVALDFLRGLLFTGFPWLDLGYSQYQYPKIFQVADLSGHFGVTFLIITSNCLVVALIKFFKADNKRALLLYQIVPALCLLTAATIYNFSRYTNIETTLKKAETINVGVIQGNIDQSQKWQPSSQADTVNSYLSLSGKLLSQQKIDILIWPETALPFFPKDNPIFDEIINQLIRPGSQALITGAPHYISESNSANTKYYNSAFIVTPIEQTDNNSITPPHNISRYDKQHLVPFGEYIPFSQYIPSSMPIVHSMGNFSAGQSKQPISCDKAKIGVLICYESIFPELGRSEVNNGANLLVNLTNDAWYGDSSAPWQQLAMVVFRAVENRRSLARSANTGISCLVDPLGNLLKVSGLFKKDKMAATLPLLSEISLYGKMGHYFPIICIIALIPLAILTIKKNTSIETSS